MPHRLHSIFCESEWAVALSLRTLSLPGGSPWLRISQVSPSPLSQRAAGGGAG